MLEAAIRIERKRTMPLSIIFEKLLSLYIPKYARGRALSRKCQFLREIETFIERGVLQGRPQSAE